jgi:hypothetical protein
MYSLRRRYLPAEPPNPSSFNQTEKPMPPRNIKSPLFNTSLLFGIAIALVTTLAMAGPGTQTEDDIYVGNKRQVQGVNRPETTTLQPRAGAGVSPNTAAFSKKTVARTGGDDDLDDLEVERRKVQGVNMPGVGSPQVRPGVGVSPNTGRSVATPARLPDKF